MAFEDDRRKADLTSLIRRLPQFKNTDTCGYPFFSARDVDRGLFLESPWFLVIDIIQCVSFGEVIERDRTVSVQCIPVGCGVPYCGWIFKATHGLHINQVDFMYIPFEETTQASILQSVPEMQQANYFCVGGKMKSEKCDIPSIKELFPFIRIILWVG